MRRLPGYALACALAVLYTSAAEAPPGRPPGVPMEAHLIGGDFWAWWSTGEPEEVSASWDLKGRLYLLIAQGNSLRFKRKLSPGGELVEQYQTCKSRSIYGTVTTPTFGRSLMPEPVCRVPDEDYYEGQLPTCEDPDDCPLPCIVFVPVGYPGPARLVRDEQLYQRPAGQPAGERHFATGSALEVLSVTPDLLRTPAGIECWADVQIEGTRGFLPCSAFYQSHSPSLTDLEATVARVNNANIPDFFCYEPAREPPYYFPPELLGQ